MRDGTPLAAIEKNFNVGPLETVTQSASRYA
jgi:hypothetical protein